MRTFPQLGALPLGSQASLPFQDHVTGAFAFGPPSATGAKASTLVAASSNEHG